MKTQSELLHELYESDDYKSLLKDICQKINLKMEGRGPEILDEFSLQDIFNAKITLPDLQNVLTTHREEFRAFLLRKNTELQDISLEQDYPEDERPGTDDMDVVLKTFAYENYLIGHMIEYWILKNNPEFLRTYLKIQKIPKAKTYEKQLNKWFFA